MKMLAKSQVHTQALDRYGSKLRTITAPTDRLVEHYVEKAVTSEANLLEDTILVFSAENEVGPPSPLKIHSSFSFKMSNDEEQKQNKDKSFSSHH